MVPRSKSPIRRTRYLLDCKDERDRCVQYLRGTRRNLQARSHCPGFQRAVYPPFTLVLNQIGTRRRTDEGRSGHRDCRSDWAQPQCSRRRRTEVTPSSILEPTTISACYTEPSAVDPFGSGCDLTVDAASMNQGSNLPRTAVVRTSTEIASKLTIFCSMESTTIRFRKPAWSHASPDAIQEFNLITQNASAEFGNFQRWNHKHFDKVRD